MNIGRFTKFAFVLAIVALIVGFSACDQIGQLLVPAQPEMPPEMEGYEIPIGVVLAQTGPFAAVYGLPMLDGYELAREHINNSGMLGGAKLKLIVKNDQSVSAVDVVNELIAGDVPAIVGFAISTQFAKVIPTAEEKGVVLFSSVSSFPGLSARGDFIFRAGLTSAVLNPPLVAATHEKFSYQKAARIYQEGDLYAQGSDEEFRKALTDRGVEVLEPEIYQADATDFSEPLTRIMASNADVLFISSLGSHIPQIMIEARELMPSVHFIVPELTNIELANIELAGASDAAEGTVTAIGWFSGTDTPMNQAFIQSYTEQYREEPVAWAAQSYATLHILAAAIVEAQSPEALRDALASTMDFPNVLGNFSFNADGDAVYDPILLNVKNGQFELLE